MKNDSIRRLDTGPFGLTRGKASVRAMVAASPVNRPDGMFVDVLVTVLTQRRGLRRTLDLVLAPLLVSISPPKIVYAIRVPGSGASGARAVRDDQK
jgi:hypothetical protein